MKALLMLLPAPQKLPSKTETCLGLGGRYQTKQTSLFLLSPDICTDLSGLSFWKQPPARCVSSAGLHRSTHYEWSSNAKKKCSHFLNGREARDVNTPGPAQGPWLGHTPTLCDQGRTGPTSPHWALPQAQNRLLTIPQAWVAAAAPAGSFPAHAQVASRCALLPAVTSPASSGLQRPLGSWFPTGVQTGPL